jgi:hypothetical protein
MNESFLDFAKLGLEEIVDAAKHMTFPIEESPCIYFLVKKGQVVYVGQTWNIYARIGSHMKSKIFDSVSMLNVHPDEMNNLEAAYILKFNPVYNKILPRSDFIPEKRARGIYGTRAITSLLASRQITRYSIHAGNFFSILELENVDVI